MLGDRTGPDLIATLAPIARPERAFLCPLFVRFHFPQIVGLLPAATDKSCMRLAAYVMAQPCGLGVQVIYEHSAASDPVTRGAGAAPRAPCRTYRAPWALGRRSGPSAAGRVSGFAPCGDRITSLNYHLSQLGQGPVGPSRGPRHYWRSARPVARDPRGAAAARRAASRCMFFTNSTEIKRYEFEKTRKWEER